MVDDYVLDLAFSRDGGQALAWSGNTLRIYDADDGTEFDLHEVKTGGKLHDGERADTALSAGPLRVAWASLDQNLNIQGFGPYPGSEKSLAGHVNPISSITFSPDGWSILSGSGWPGSVKPNPEKISLRLWSIAGNERRSYEPELFTKRRENKWNHRVIFSV